jgi:hypothetical protein
MGNIKNIENNGFKEHPERINKKGRPKKLVSLLKMEGYSLSQINDTISNLLALSIDELKEIMKTGLFEGEAATAFEQTIASAICKDKARGEIITITGLLTRSFGTPKQTIDHTVHNDDEFDFSKLNDDELEKLIELQSKIRISKEKAD